MELWERFFRVYRIAGIVAYMAAHIVFCYLFFVAANRGWEHSDTNQRRCIAVQQGTTTWGNCHTNFMAVTPTEPLMDDPNF